MRPQNGLFIFLEKTHSERSWKSSTILPKKLQQQQQILKIVKVFACGNKNLRHLRRFRVFEFFSSFGFFFICFFFSFSFCFPIFFQFSCFLFFCIIFFFLSQPSEQTPKPIKIVEHLLPFVKMTISFCDYSILGFRWTGGGCQERPI